MPRAIRVVTVQSGHCASVNRDKLGAYSLQQGDQIRVPKFLLYYGVGFWFSGFLLSFIFCGVEYIQDVTGNGYLSSRTRQHKRRQLYQIIHTSD